MDFTFSEEQKILFSEFEKLCREKIEPNAEVLDRNGNKDSEGKVIRENFKILADFGYLGAFFPSELGGSSLDFVTYFTMAEYLAKACASTYLSSMAHTLLCANFIYMFGSNEQKRKYIPKLSKGEFLGALCATEPSGGSDLAALKTKAEKKTGKFVIWGNKSFVTNGTIADIFIVLARIPLENKTKRYDGITAFILERDDKGLSVGQPYDKLGARGSPTCDVFLEGVEVSPERVLGSEGQGFQECMKVFDIGRIGMAIYSLGIISACLDECKKYANERYAFGKRISSYEDVNFKIVDMQVALDTGRVILQKCAYLQDNKAENIGAISSIAKLFISEKATKLSSDAVQIFGGTGYIRGTKVERLYRDAKLGEIGEGTSEIQRRVIFRNLMKEFGLSPYR